MDVDSAIPLGLIINELVTNAFKYAFTDIDQGLLSIRLSKSDNDGFRLTVKDNGIGKTNQKNGFGEQLVNILAVQLGAKIKSGNENGYWFDLVK